MVMARKILEVEKNPLITSECWTYYKLSVMQTIPFFDLWLANHMKMYLDQNGDAVFGDNGCMYPLSYFSDILDISDANILSVSADKIVQFLINQIDENNYIIIDVNYKKLKDRDSLQFWLHETLIYGYDTENEEFFTPMLSHGTFKETRIGFEELALAYKDAYERYTQDKALLFNRRVWFYGITALKPKKEYENTNVFYDFIYKLKWEKEGNFYERQKHASDFEHVESYVYYTGISCMLYLASYTRKLMEHEDIKEGDIVRCRNSCLKIYENQKIVLRSMKWFRGKIANENEVLEELSQKYEKCCEQVYINVLQYEKRRYTKNQEILVHVIENLEQLYWLEKEILEEYIVTATSVYTKYLEFLSMYEKKSR